MDESAIHKINVWIFFFCRGQYLDIYFSVSRKKNKKMNSLRPLPTTLVSAFPQGTHLPPWNLQWFGSARITSTKML